MNFSFICQTAQQAHTHLCYCRCLFKSHHDCQIAALKTEGTVCFASTVNDDHFLFFYEKLISFSRPHFLLMISSEPVTSTNHVHNPLVITRILALTASLTFRYILILTQKP